MRRVGDVGADDGDVNTPDDEVDDASGFWAQDVSASEVALQQQDRTRMRSRPAAKPPSKPTAIQALEADVTAVAATLPAKPATPPPNVEINVAG